MMMRAIVFDRLGSNFGVVARELRVPDIGDYEVLYRVAAFGLNQADLLLMQGRHYVNSDLPMRLGYEGSGVVEAVGRSVHRFKCGDRVTCLPNVDGPYSTGGTFALAHERFLTGWPSGFSGIEAAAFWMQYLTAYYPMIELFPIKPGDWVLITAASGGTGTGAIRMARLLGGRVIATSRTAEKTSFLKDHGAEHVLATNSADLVQQIRAITDGIGVRLICDSLGGPRVAALAETLADQGVIYVHGGLSGVPELSLPVLTLVRRGAGLYGYSLINELRKPGALERGRDFVIDALASGKLSRPTIDRVFPLEFAPDAYEYMNSGVQRGKIIVATGSTD